MPEKNRFLEAALFYAGRLGWPVLPVCAHAKKPPLTKNGSLDASIDEKQIRLWWEQWPAANVAVRTGVRFWVLDVDPQHGGEESYARLVYARGALACTLQQKTGGGGSQYFYEQPDQCVITGKAPLYNDWPGIDARGQNNYVIVPPSIHPNGNEYVWDTARRTILEEPVMPADGWLLEWVLAAANGNGASHGFQPPPEKIAHGQQHKYLVSEAGKLRDLGLGYEEIVEAIWQTNLLRCEQPGPRKNIEQIARSMMKYTPKHAHTLPGSVPEPAPAPVNGRHPAEEEAGEKSEPADVQPAGVKEEIPDAELLDRTEEYIRCYVVLPENAYLPASLWAVATHAVQEFETFPYIAAVSAAKRSGKTRFAEVLETIVRKPWRGTAPSPAAVYRYLEDAPTLLLDETEPLNAKNKSEMTQILLSVLNVGYRKGATVLKCDGTEHKPRRFPVYGPKLFAGIGRLPDTLMDRSIVVHMKRRTKSQKIGRFLQARVLREVRPLHDAIVRFVQKHRSLIEESYQVVVDQDLDYLGDRDAEMWMPLFALCAVLSSGRLGELRKCAETLSGSKTEDDEDDSYSLGLLKDIREVWPGENGLFSESAKSDKCETAVLIEKLKALEESPWAEHQLTPRKLARILRPFDVLPRQVWVNERNAKGYIWTDFKDVFDRYLDEKRARSAKTQ
jgi:hypothetical protein